MTSKKVLVEAVEALRESQKEFSKIIESKKEGIDNFWRRACQKQETVEFFLVDRKEGNIDQYSWSFKVKLYAPPETKWLGYFDFKKRKGTTLHIPVSFDSALDKLKHSRLVSGRNQGEQEIVLESAYREAQKERNLRRLVNLYSQPFFVIKPIMKDEDILAYFCLYALRKNFFEDNWPYLFLKCDYIPKLTPYFKNKDDREEAINEVIARLIWKPKTEKVWSILQKFGIPEYKEWEKLESEWGKEGNLALAIGQILEKLPPNEYGKFASNILKELSKDPLFGKSFFGWPHSEKSLKSFIRNTLEGIAKDKAKVRGEPEALGVRKRKEDVSRFPKIVDEVAAELNIPRMFIYRAIWGKKISPMIAERVSSRLVGEVKVKIKKLPRYLLTQENIKEIKKLYEEKTKKRELRKNLVEVLIEKRKITRRAARRWIRRRTDKGLSYEEIVKEVLKTKPRGQEII